MSKHKDKLLRDEFWEAVQSVEGGTRSTSVECEADDAGRIEEAVEKGIDALTAGPVPEDSQARLAGIKKWYGGTMQGDKDAEGVPVFWKSVGVTKAEWERHITRMAVMTRAQKAYEAQLLEAKKTYDAAVLRARVQRVGEVRVCQSVVSLAIQAGSDMQSTADWIFATPSTKRTKSAEMSEVLMEDHKQVVLDARGWLRFAKGMD